MSEEPKEKAIWPLLLLGAATIFGSLQFFTGAGSQTDGPETTPLKAQNMPVPFEAVELSYLPKPSFADKEGDVYSYIAALTDEERETGKAVGDVVSYTYDGQNTTGRHVVSIVNSRGELIGRYECKDPCKIIEPRDGERFPAGQSLLITSVFNDAINGHLELSRNATFPKFGDESDVPFPVILASLPDALRCEWFKEGSTLETPHLAFTDDGKMLQYSYEDLSPTEAEINLVKLLGASSNFQTFRVILKGGRGSYVDFLFYRDSGILSVGSERGSRLRLERRHCGQSEKAQTP